MYKVDLHTHSIASKDGGITRKQYEKILSDRTVDMIAITDHDRIDFATQLKHKFGDHVIIGEEIMTAAGEIIGLYLKEWVPPGLSPKETMKRIKEQGGLVYVPHPFESIRHGLHPADMEDLLSHIDLVEVCNGRAFFQNRSEQTAVWARLNSVVGAASSDAHGIKGVGRTYTSVRHLPTKETLIDEIAHGIPITGRPTAISLMYPKYNRLRKKMGAQ